MLEPETRVFWTPYVSVRSTTNPTTAISSSPLRNDFIYRTSLTL